MPNTSTQDRNRKVTNFTIKLPSGDKSIKSNPKSRNLKRPISPSSASTKDRSAKGLVTGNCKISTMDTDELQSTSQSKPKELTSKLQQEVENDTVLKNALGPLITEFRLLR